MKKLAMLLLLLWGPPSLAQQGATAELTGRVTSAGQALPGVTVTVTSDALQGSRVRFYLLPTIFCVSICKDSRHSRNVFAFRWPKRFDSTPSSRLLPCRKL